MKDSKNAILQNIRSGLRHEWEIPFPNTDMTQVVLKKQINNPAEQFAACFTQRGGRFIFCQDIDYFFMQFQLKSKKHNWDYVHCWNPELQEWAAQRDIRNIKPGYRLDLAHAGLTTCEALIADNGGILISSALPAGRTLAIYPPVWIVVAWGNQIVENTVSAYQFLNEKYNGILPTMTKVIYGAAQNNEFSVEPINGGMGPEKIYLFFIDQEKPNGKSSLQKMENLQKEVDENIKQKAKKIPFEVEEPLSNLIID